MPKKKRVLFLTEATYLSTGYATYSKQVLERLHKSGKYEIAEMSVYGQADDHRRSTIKWKNYANMPDPKNEEHVKAYTSSVANQFGSWRFERVCLDFEPDIVLSIRDFWMDSFIFHSPFRRIFNWAWMPTVDASPQNDEWISMFGDADYILTYSEWAKGIIEKQGGKAVNTVGVASPSAAECFQPMNKAEIRKEFGLDENINIIGTVMRNQRRKLFPALIESFAKYLRKTGSTNTFLYCHTSYPDGGWNLAELLHRHGVSSRVLFTYVCEECGAVEASFFNDARKQCNSCKKFRSTPASVSNGLDDSVLAKVYNLFDLYIQCANSEGFGLPQVEAAACGIPIACTNYSAMEDLVYKAGAYPIALSDVYKELETGCDRAVPSQDSILYIFDTFFNKKNGDEREALSKSTRKLFEENYSWDTTTEAWMKVIDDCPYADWQQQSIIKQMVEIPIDQPNTSEFMRQLVSAYNYTDSQKHSHFIKSIHKDLNRGTTRTGFDGYYSSEVSPFHENKQKPLSRKQIVEFFKSRLHNYNVWETVRKDRSKLKDSNELWLN